MQKNTRKEWPFLPDMKSISFNISVILTLFQLIIE